MWDAIPHDIWDKCRAFADAIDNLKKPWKASRYWNKDAHFVGLLGEAVVAEHYKLPMNMNLTIGGDGHADFNGVIDVKTSSYISDPHLKLTPQDIQRDMLFLLVAIDLPRRKYKICGSAHSKLVKEQGTKINYGYGDMYCMKADQLSPGIPAVYILPK